MRMTGLARSTLYKPIAQKPFPAPVKLSERAVAWLQPEIDTWIGSRARSSSAERATFRTLQNQDDVRTPQARKGNGLAPCES